MLTPYVIGVDLGGTHLRAALADGSGRLLAQLDERTRADLVEQLERVIGELATVQAGPRVARTVIGGAGVPDGNDSLSHAPNLTLSPGVALARLLSERVGHPVTLENDVNVAAVGELYDGVGRTHRDFVVVSVGTGIGAGVVLDGRLVRGTRGAAGEIGYLPLGTDPLDPAHHTHGALEEIASGRGMARRYTELTGDEVPAVTIFERAEHGDTDAREIIDDAARWTAGALASLVAVLDPGIAVLAGGIGSRQDFHDRVVAWLPRFGAELPIVQSHVVDGAPLRGAVRLALDLHRSVQNGAVS